MTGVAGVSISWLEFVNAILGCFEGGPVSLGEGFSVDQVKTVIFITINHFNEGKRTRIEKNCKKKRELICTHSPQVTTC